EEEADELYHDIDINQGRGLQVSQNIKDSHVTLTLVYPDGLQESSSMSSFVTSMLNPISDAGVESIFTTASSPIVSLQTSTPIMTPSTIAIITTFNDAPIPSTTIPSTILENLPTFDSVKTNLFVDAVSAIPGKGYAENAKNQSKNRAISTQDWKSATKARLAGNFLKIINAVRMNFDYGERAGQAGLEFSRKDLKTGIEEQDLITDIEDAVIDL
nr:hypothetical protein [Tanacetum cinerariifolium]